MANFNDHFLQPKRSYNGDITVPLLFAHKEDYGLLFVDA